ncbi:MAG TPA: hypothetical protein VFB62_04040, partial [Polyangiaceae bacterium]|nr:hypothetical protein [Polyangiaceae bacterium]
MKKRFVTALVCAALLGSAPAQAVGSLSGGSHRPLEQRVASAGNALWTQLRVASPGGPLAIIVPAEPGAALDWSSPAWFEALESATAPRILPPNGIAACPGDEPASVVDVAGDLYHHDPLTPQEVIVLDDAGAVVSWAEQHGLVVSGAMWTALLGLETAHRFVAARFTAPNGEALTPALRVTGLSAQAALPLVLTAAGNEDLLVTTFVLGPGRAAFDGEPASILLGSLTFDAASTESNYPFLRSSALESPGTWLLETTSRAALTSTIQISGVSIDGALHTYFTRGALYLGGAVDAAQCIGEATRALDSAGAFSQVCPRADLGVVSGGPSCSEAPGVIDAARLRCGTALDDLAIGLSGQVAASAWLSRIAIQIPHTEHGSWRTVTFSSQAAIDPVLEAKSVDVSGCFGGGETSAASSGSSGSGGATGAAQVPVYPVDSSCGAREVGGDP